MGHKKQRISYQHEAAAEGAEHLEKTAKISKRKKSQKKTTGEGIYSE